MVSLKRTLQFNLASSIEVLNPINQDVPRSNLHTPLRYSAVLLSIGKTTQICHQDIPLKKINCNGVVKYVSALPRKLEKVWQQPSRDIATSLIAVLQERTTYPVWSSLRRTDEDWLEFVISQAGIMQWQQQLKRWPLPPAVQPAWPTTSDLLWQLQSGYELCCRWQRCHPANSPTRSSNAAFLIRFQPLHQLIHCLLDICDRWHQTSPLQLLHQAQHLVIALERCIALATLSPETKAVSDWLEPTRVVLQQSLNGRLGYQLIDQF